MMKAVEMSMERDVISKAIREKKILSFRGAPYQNCKKIFFGCPW